MRIPTGFLLLVSAAFLLGVPVAGQPANSPGEAPIRLKQGTFLPSRGGPDLPAGLRHSGSPPGSRGVFLVQFAGPVRQAWKDAVTGAGGTLLDYVPDFAFKVRMTSRQAQSVRRLASVRWVGAFQPGYKVSPRLVRGGERLYTVRIERDANAAATEAALVGAGQRVLMRQGRTLVVAAREEQIDALAGQSDVAWVENFVLREKHNEYGGQVILDAQAANGAGYDGSTQVVALADTGVGAGTASTVHPDIPASRVAGIFNWPGTSTAGCFTIVDDGARDVDTGHGTHTSASAVSDGDASGRGKGTAPASSLVFQAVENFVEFEGVCSSFFLDGYYLIGLPTDLSGVFQQAYDAGARVHSNSWGSPAAGEYTADSQNVDAFVWSHQDLTIAFSAGNDGTDADTNGGLDGRTIGSPATAKNIISVGASENDRASDYECDAGANAVCAAQGGQNQIPTYGSTWPFDFPAEPLKSDPIAGGAEQMAAFSGTGPTDDGRIKPDLVAPGTWVLSGFSSLHQEAYGDPPNPQTGLYQNDGTGFPQSAEYKYFGGTSMSSPLVAGGAAVVRDYLQKDYSHSASAALVKAVLINSAVDLLDENNDGVDDNALPIPNFYEGWGRVNLGAATDGSRVFRDGTTALQTNETVTHSYQAAAGTPLKVTLVWSDYPSSLPALRRLVNDLDLEVSGPGSVLYRGNAFAVASGGWSIPDSGLPDRANNVENVYVQSPAAGTWTVAVKGYNVPQGPQPFALVVAGGSLQALHPLAVTKDGAGSGTVTSVPPAIDCGAICSADFPESALVELLAAPEAGSVLLGWTGACTGPGSCFVTMNKARSVGATFTLGAPPTASVGDAAIDEGNCATTNLVFAVTLSHASPLPVQVDYATTDGTATAGEDYVSGSGTLVFAPGVVLRTVAIAVTGDPDFETDEALTLGLSEAINATVGDETGEGLILDDDPSLLPGEEALRWAREVGATSCGNDLLKTGADGWNAGASSTRALASGDGYVEFSGLAATSYGLMGLSSRDTHPGYQDMDFALFPYAPAGQVFVFESGVFQGAALSYSAGDRLRVSVEQGMVRYRRNGELIHQSIIAPTYPLLVDTSLYNTGARIMGTALAGTLVDVSPEETVVWQNLVGVTTQANSLLKTAVDGWNAGASSTRALASGDGYVEFTDLDASSYGLMGLSSGDDDPSYQDIDFALFPYAPAGQVFVFEGGIYQGAAISYSPGDRLRVSVEQGVVRYRRNGELIYQSTVAPTYPLLVDTSLYNTGARIDSAVLAGTLQ